MFKGRRTSIKSSLKFHISGSEDEMSLERIHTFNLKLEANKRDVFSEGSTSKKESPVRKEVD